jgi:hypothetical protein
MLTFLLAECFASEPVENTYALVQLDQTLLTSAARGLALLDALADYDELRADAPDVELFELLAAWAAFDCVFGDSLTVYRIGYNHALEPVFPQSADDLFTVLAASAGRAVVIAVHDKDDADFARQRLDGVSLQLESPQRRYRSAGCSWTTWIRHSNTAYTTMALPPKLIANLLSMLQG